MSRENGYRISYIRNDNKKTLDDLSDEWRQECKKAKRVITSLFLILILGLISVSYYLLSLKKSVDEIGKKLDFEFEEVDLKIKESERGMIEKQFKLSEKIDEQIEINNKHFEDLESKLERQEKKISELQKFFKSPYKSEKSANKLPANVQLAVHKYGETILKYEVNGGKKADQELVMAILTRRLYNKAKKHPEWNEKQLIESVAKGWNPGKHKNFKQIANSVKNKKSLIDKDIIINASNLDFETPVGKTIWDKKYNHFAHTKQMPSYYSKLNKKGYLASEHGLKWKTYVGSEIA